MALAQPPDLPTFACDELPSNDDARPSGPPPPHDLDAEGATISAVLLDALAFPKVADFLRPEYFYSEAHRRIFEACIALRDLARPIDIVNVATWLRDHERLAQVGGMAYLTEVLNSAPAVTNVRSYAETVEGKWRGREALFAAQHVTSQIRAGIAPSAILSVAADTFARLALSREAPGPGPAPEEPLRGLTHLSKVAVVGREAIVALAERPIVWMWEHIATSGLVVLLAAGVGCGKTTLLFMLIIARATRGAPIKILGYEVIPASESQFIVIIENEHSDESASRILVRTCSRLGVDTSALDRIILVARGSVRIGSPEWGDVEKLIAAGLVSDVVLDTLARTAPSDANDEREQVEVYERIAQSIERAPSAASRPGFWVAAHTRKVDGLPTLNDVSGSTQRAGQADVVLLMGAERMGDKIANVKVAFGKVREKDAEDWPEPVSYVVRRDVVEVLGEPAKDERPTEVRIAEHLRLFGPATKSQLRKKLGCGAEILEPALTALFAAKHIRTTDIKTRTGTYSGFELREGFET